MEPSGTFVSLNAYSYILKPYILDYKNFNYILAADDSNLYHLERMKPNDSTATIKLWGSYSDGKAIEDPYYGGKVRPICC